MLSTNGAAAAQGSTAEVAPAPAEALSLRALSGVAQLAQLIEENPQLTLRHAPPAAGRGGGNASSADGFAFNLAGAAINSANVTAMLRAAGVNTEP